MGAIGERLTATSGDTRIELRVVGVAALPDVGAVANFGRVDRLPLVLAVLTGLVAMGTLLHALLLSVGRRRRELAVLKVLGFTRRQMLVTVATHASTLVAVSLVIGLPLGDARRTGRRSGDRQPGRRPARVAGGPDPGRRRPAPRVVRALRSKPGVRPVDQV